MGMGNKTSIGSTVCFSKNLLSSSLWKYRRHQHFLFINFKRDYAKTVLSLNLSWYNSQLESDTKLVKKNNSSKIYHCRLRTIGRSTRVVSTEVIRSLCFLSKKHPKLMFLETFKVYLMIFSDSDQTSNSTWNIIWRGYDKISKSPQR